MEEEPRYLAFEIKNLNQMIGRALMNLSMKNEMDQMTVRHARIIGYLYRNRDQDIFQKDLEAKFHITSSTVTSILKLMEKKGYIRRVSVERDARLKKLVLTETGEKIQSQHFENFLKMQGILEEEITREIPAQELAVFRSVLNKMKENLSRKETEEGWEPLTDCCEGFGEKRLKMREE